MKTDYLRNQQGGKRVKIKVDFWAHFPKGL